jgi:hypothetical protein
MSKKKKALVDSSIESLDCDYELAEEDGFIEGNVDFSKYALATFNFTNNNNSIRRTEEQKQCLEAVVDIPALEHQASIDTAPETKTKVEEAIPDIFLNNGKQQAQPYGITPPVDGEHFELSRTFKFRRSTVKMINQIKAEHQYENVYLSSIVDDAIRYYYQYIINGNGIVKSVK